MVRGHMMLWSVWNLFIAYLRSIKFQRLKSQTKRDLLYSIKVKSCPRLPKTPHLNTAQQIYVTVREDLHNTAQMFTQRKRHNFYSHCSIVAAAGISWRRCVFPNMVRGVPFPSHAWGILPITMHWIAQCTMHLSKHTWSIFNTQIIAI